MFPSSLTINPQNLSPSLLYFPSLQRAHSGDAAGPGPHQRRGEVQTAPEQVRPYTFILSMMSNNCFFSLHETSARRDDSCPVKAKLAQVSTDLNTFLIGECNQLLRTFLK